MSLTFEEQQQYSRQIILEEIGEEGQLKLKKASVLVVGAGGLGCSVLQYLTGAGVGTIGIVDGDIVEVSNLQRQILYTQNDIGKQKAVVASQKLALLNPYVNFKIHTQRLQKENALEWFAEYQIIVDGTDNFAAKYLINDAAVLSKKPVVFGSIFKFEGQVTVYNYQLGPTYRCLYPNPPKIDSVPNCSEIGVLGVLPGIIGCFQANEVIKIILELEPILSGKVLLFNALSLQQQIITFPKNKEINIIQLAENYEEFCAIPLEIKEIAFNTYKQNKTVYRVLDVREEIERSTTGYISGSIHIPLNELEERFWEISDTKKLLVYCQSGVRSKKAIALLRKTGFVNELLNLKDGWQNREWQNEKSDIGRFNPQEQGLDVQK